eukprot:9632000-Lingulodinium_polyedra.AAC.1
MGAGSQEPVRGKARRHNVVAQAEGLWLQAGNRKPARRRAGLAQRGSASSGVLTAAATRAV